MLSPSVDVWFKSSKRCLMNEELFDIEGENKIPENKKGILKQECLTLEEIEKLLEEPTKVEISVKTIPSIDSFDTIAEEPTQN